MKSVELPLSAVIALFTIAGLAIGTMTVMAILNAWLAPYVFILGCVVGYLALHVFSCMKNIRNYLHDPKIRKLLRKNQLEGGLEQLKDFLSEVKLRMKFADPIEQNRLDYLSKQINNRINDLSRVYRKFRRRPML